MDLEPYLIIAITELAAYVLLGALVAPLGHWSGALSLLVTDNQVAQQWVCNMEARIPAARALLRLLRLLQCCFSFASSSTYVRTINNEWNDDITRMEEDEVEKRGEQLKLTRMRLSDDEVVAKVTAWLADPLSIVAQQGAHQST